jgi:hypothetical protein
MRSSVSLKRGEFCRIRHEGDKPPRFLVTCRLRRDNRRKSLPYNNLSEDDNEGDKCRLRCDGFLGEWAGEKPLIESETVLVNIRGRFPYDPF